MRIIDRYLARYFVFIVLAALAAFVILYILIDVIENLDTFIDNKAPFTTVVMYYLFYIPFMVNLTLPVAVLLSSLFTIGQMVRNNEVVCLQASGVSLYRVLSPLFVLAVLISLLSFLFAETVVPWANFHRAQVKQSEIKKAKSSAGQTWRDLALQDSPNRLIYIEEYASKTKVATGVLIQLDDGVRITRSINAKTMAWNGDMWVLSGVKTRIFNGEDGEHEEFLETEQMDYRDLKVRPEDLTNKPKNPEEMNIIELKKYIKRKQQLGREVLEEKVELYSKQSFPFVHIIIVLFGTALASIQRRSGAAFNFGISLFICFVYYSVMRAGWALGRSGNLPPLLSAWIVHGVFGLMGLFILMKARK